MEARIITLEPETEIQGVSFEEAFGEHSELKGRGRARRQVRRQKRRMTRIANRTERLAAKQEARQTRKDIRASRKEARKRMGDDPESENESNDMSQEQPIEQQPMEQSYNEPSQDEQSYNEEAQEPLGDNSEYSDEESSFDAETSGETSSFDAEMSDASGKRIKNRLGIMKDKIAKHEGAVNKLKDALRSGKLPSNMVAKAAKELKARVNHLDKMKEVHAKAVVRMKSLTPVQSGLNATIGDNKIVIPAKGADGEDSSMMEGDEMSSFDGKTFFAKNKGVIVGLGAAAVIIFALHKAKVFK
jgi:hypothetical protein